jgi:hypothetical protein
LSLPRGYLSIDGVSPDGTGNATFIIAKKKIDDLQRSGPAFKFLELHIVKATLETPDAIFQDLKREDLRDSYCYSKVPAVRKLSSTIEAPFPPDLVFLVFVNRDHRGLVILDWEKRKADPDHYGHPLNWETDFERRAWLRH